MSEIGDKRRKAQDKRHVPIGLLVSEKRRLKGFDVGGWEVGKSGTKYDPQCTKRAWELADFRKIWR